MRIAIISDIHANQAALVAVLAAIRGLKGPAATQVIWCLGDVVGYGPMPNECIDIVRQAAAVCVAGNHDLASIGRLPTDSFIPAAAAAVEWTGRHLTAESRTFLESLPLKAEQSGCTLVHGSPREPVWEYVHSAEAARENLAYFSTRLCLVGHTHVPVAYCEHGQSISESLLTPGALFRLPASENPSRRCLANPGSVGQPRDGDPRAAFAVLDTDAWTLLAYRVEYPIGETQDLILAAGLPAKLAARLERGW